MKAQFPAAKQVATQNLSASINYFEIDSQTLFVLAGSPSFADPYGVATLDTVRGDWLYVPQDSQLALRADIVTLNPADTTAVELSAGMVVRAPIQRIKVYCQLPSGANALPVNPPNPYPVLRIFYGTGACPFDSTATPRAGHLLGLSSSVAGTPSSVSNRYRVNEGMQVAVDFGMSRVLAAGDLADFYAYVALETSATVELGRIAPANFTKRDVLAALGGAVQCFGNAHFEPFIVPRGCSIIRLVASDVLGTGVGVCTFIGPTVRVG
jgi:hypothetical protein